jgi:hypothetical protein
MSHVNWTDVTQRGQILKISFGPVHFSRYLKRDKIQKSIAGVHQNWKCTHHQILYVVILVIMRDILSNLDFTL